MLLLCYFVAVWWCVISLVYAGIKVGKRERTAYSNPLSSLHPPSVSTHPSSSTTTSSLHPLLLSSSLLFFSLLFSSSSLLYSHLLLFSSSILISSSHSSSFHPLLFSFLFSSSSSSLLFFRIAGSGSGFCHSATEQSGSEGQVHLGARGHQGVCSVCKSVFA